MPLSLAARAHDILEQATGLDLDGDGETGASDTYLAVIIALAGILSVVVGVLAVGCIRRASKGADHDNGDFGMAGHHGPGSAPGIQLGETTANPLA